VDGKTELAQSRAARIERAFNGDQDIVSVSLVLRVQRRRWIVVIISWAFTAQKQNTKAAWKKHSAASKVNRLFMKR